MGNLVSCVSRLPLASLSRSRAAFLISCLSAGMLLILWVFPLCLLTSVELCRRPWSCTMSSHSYCLNLSSEKK